MAEMAANNSRKNQGPYIPRDLLNDLSSRFIINVPEEERSDLTRLCFQIELAHWFYLDFYCEENPKLPKCTVREFIHIIFRHIPFLQKYNNDIDSIIVNWRGYKSAVPTYGGILLDKDLKNVLLVQSFYSKASWGFPKGKVNEDEKPHHCAIREVYEETGFDISNYIKTDEFLEHYFNEQLIRLYIITGISPDAKFQPRTRKEIKAIEWFPVNNLPTGKKDETSRTKLGPNNFFMVIPFVKKLQKWIASNAFVAVEDKSNQSLHEKEQDYLKQQQRLFSQLTKMQWTSDKIDKLIDLYQEHPSLWDVKHDTYKNIRVKADAWAEIAFSLESDVREIKTKIKNINDSFRRELKKEKDSIRSGTSTEELYISRWYLYGKLSFLKDRYTQTTVNTEDLEEINVVNEEEMTPIETPKTKKRKRNEDDQIDEALALLNNISERKKSSEEDSNAIFCKYINSRLKNYNPRTVQVVREKIWSILCSADRGHFDQQPILTNQFLFHPNLNNSF